MKLAKLTMAAATVATLTLTSGVAVFAKGGQPSTSAGSVPTTAGPCAYEWITEGDHILYPLTNDKYPGVVSVDMIWTGTGAPTVNSVCLDTGWTVESRPATDGVQLRFSYKGTRAIDFKFVLGKTDIRNY